MKQAVVRIEYRDYLDRAAGSSPEWRAGVLSYEEFCQLLGRWQREYHPAWVNNDLSRLAELEHALLLDAEHSPQVVSVCIG